MSLTPSFIVEPERSTPVSWEGDLCVVGGSCTGVFAAVRAARMGLSVALVEQGSIWGGMATAAQVNEWHSVYDAFAQSPVIGGLTIEVIERLRLRGCVLEAPRGSRGQFKFNSAEMVLELDDLIASCPSIRPFLCCRCVGAVTVETAQGRKLTEAVIEDKSGRRAIRARYFIDASGDGELLRRAGFPARLPKTLQPVTLQALVYGLQEICALNGGKNVWRIWDEICSLAKAHHYPLENGTPWFFDYPGADSQIYNAFGPRQHGVDASDADDLTRSLLRGRRFHRALTDMIEERFGFRPSIIAWPQMLGVRETWHAQCLHQLSGEELLNGTVFTDAIACGTYPVDIHSNDGTRIYYLDGRMEIIGRSGHKEDRRWRDENLTPPCYYIPLRSLLLQNSVNLMVAGRILDADENAFGAVRVMVNMNQTGEAAGTACALACVDSVSLADVEAHAVRRELLEGGSVFSEPLMAEAAMRAH